MGLKPEDFWMLEPKEFSIIFDNWIENRNMEEDSEWEKIATLSYFIYSSVPRKTHLSYLSFRKRNFKFHGKQEVDEGEDFDKLFKEAEEVLSRDIKESKVLKSTNF